MKAESQEETVGGGRQQNDPLHADTGCVGEQAVDDLLPETGASFGLAHGYGAEQGGGAEELQACTCEGLVIKAQPVL